MKISRRALLFIVAGLGVFLIAYSLFRHLTGIGLGEEEEKQMTNIIIFAALGIFVYNRKLAQDEKKAKEAVENEKNSDNNVEEPLADESLPHWEREKNNDDSKDSTEKPTI